MHRLHARRFSCALLLPVLTGIATPALAATPAENEEDACSLLLPGEIHQVQGQKYTEAKSSSSIQGNMLTSQCYFALPRLVDSLSLSVTQRATGSQAQDPRAYWKELFERRRESAPKRDRKEDSHGDPGEENEDRNAPPPRKISQLGESAYWEGSPVGGSLYVLKGHRFFRISVGGRDSTKVKLRKSVRLARMILKRL